MALGVLSVLSTLFGLGHSASQLAAVRTAGQAQQDQAVEHLKENINRNSQLAEELYQASTAGTLANAASGKYSILQNTQASTLETQLKIANKWMQILGAP